MIDNSKPFVSVIVCAYNEEKIIKLCLDALLSQNYPNDFYEIIVIENESTDNTFDICENVINDLYIDSPRLVVLQKKHGGLSESRNLGIKRSRGSILLFIDADAIPDEKWIYEIVNAFRGGADFIGGRIELLNTNSEVAKFLQLTRHKQFFGPTVFNDHFIGCNMAFKKSLFDSVGGFYENFTSRGDESSLFEKIKETFTYGSAPDAVVYHERPEKLIDFYRSEWKSATLSSMVRFVLGSSISVKLLIVWFEMFFVSLFLPIVCLFWLDPSALSIPLSISMLAVIRRLYMRPYNNIVLKGVIQNYGFIVGIIYYLLFYLTLESVKVAGIFYSLISRQDYEIILPHSTQTVYLSEYDSDYHR